MEIKTKLTIDDECYFMYNNKVQRAQVTKILVEISKPFGNNSTNTEIVYIVKFSEFHKIKECDAFESKAKLLESL